MRRPIRSRRVRCPPAALALLALLAFPLTAAACGGSDDAATASSPAPHTSTFTTGSLDGLPLPPRSSPLGPRTEEDGVVVRSYEVRNRTPAAVVTFFVDQLADRGWTRITPAEGSETGVDTQATFESDAGHLKVTATKAPTVDDDNPTTQFSLELRP